MPSGYRLGAAHHVGHLGSGLVPCQAAGQGGSVWTLRGAGLPLHPRSNFFPEQSPTTKTQDCSQAPGAGMGTTVKPRTLPTDVCPPCPQHSVHPKSSRALGAMARERAGGTPAAPTRVRVSHGSWLLYSSHQSRRARHFPFTDEETEAGGASGHRQGGAAANLGDSGGVARATSAGARRQGARGKWRVNIWGRNPGSGDRASPRFPGARVARAVPDRKSVV